MIRGSLVALGLLLASSACRTPPPAPAPACPLRVVAVLPVSCAEGVRDADLDRFTDIFSSEWVKVAGVRAIRPPWTGGASGKPPTLEEALRLARDARADAFVAASLTGYDPYDPPRLGISLQYFRVHARTLPDSEVDRLVQSASWRRGPVPLSRDKAGHWITSFERIFDAHDRDVRDRLARYARENAGGGPAGSRERDILAVQPRYMQFVSNQVIHEILDAARHDEP
jgi:hypothetical protein